MQWCGMIIGDLLATHSSPEAKKVRNLNVTGFRVAIGSIYLKNLGERSQGR